MDGKNICVRPNTEAKSEKMIKWYKNREEDKKQE